MDKKCEFSFRIVEWKVVTNKLLSEDDWRLGAEHWYKNRSSFEDFTPKLTFLPAMKRRRLSDLARLFFEAAWELVPEEQSNIPVVYASRNSEINRNFALWQQLLTEGDVSPTSFSLSVHNALVGQWSEFRQVTTETIAITARQDNLETALLEAYLLLDDGYERVLVVSSEYPLAESYNVQPVERQPFAYALAMVIEKGEQYSLALSTINQEKLTVCKSSLFTSDSTLMWVHNQFVKKMEWDTVSSSGAIWKWQKK
ncbi:beta-ketoacyl synthase chain length factor [Haemophilus influenzae]|uniref:Beta-ketoacyl synthase-like N-terminal domain-containing protein n=1 Tax=Haemophilus influenzae TaxID=727 RepID=A0AB37B7Q0_HAEIF|nr:beta-ketoacyl synthase chain length factor [Haemophilus influenzae]PRJ22705.1 hypothetical protein BV056_00543 [Haemophilus influenzae]PRJ72289.1 hypothetical protein BV115_00936 [Haemophilus influenzae]PRM81493.1 hypothetical protein BV055_01730 [Haemophilus influenzae]